MRFRAPAAAICALYLLLAQGCGYLPSEMPGVKGRDSNGVLRHTTRCSNGARGFSHLTFADLFITTGDPDTPFRASDKLPQEYDVSAYVWSYKSCEGTPNCAGGGYFTLIERGPRGDYGTWVVTPQYPRIVVQSRCRDQLRTGERYRFSFSRGQMVGFNR
ncbi:hypothetical protein [Microbulbifer sp. TYP-18]|uniref:hypothetical protein n=1 Tax=Microbulbifer sp. TYP-18 TaxID=3230024 RepID=UPI0034C6D10B